MTNKGEYMIIRKYGNRKLYNQKTKQYTTLEEILRLVKAEMKFTVIDNTWGGDITTETILKAIHEKELIQKPNMMELIMRARKIDLGEIL